MDDLGEEDGVITGFNHLRGGTLEVRERGRDERHARGARAPFDAVKTVEATLGKALGKRLLVLGEDVDGVVGGSAKKREEVGGVVDANEHEGWSEGDGGEGVDRHAVGSALGVEDGSDGNTGGKLRAGTAKQLGVEHEVLQEGDGDAG